MYNILIKCFYYYLFNEGERWNLSFSLPKVQKVLIGSWEAGSMSPCTVF